MTTIEDLQHNDGDWAAAFEYAGDPIRYDWDDEDDGTRFKHGEPAVSACIGTQTPADPVRRRDVTRVVAASEGENDGPAWVIVVELKDGRFAFLTAGCDYTGWDCKAGGHCIVDTDLAHLVRFGLGEGDRARLGL